MTSLIRVSSRVGVARTHLVDQADDQSDGPNFGQRAVALLAARRADCLVDEGFFGHRCLQVLVLVVVWCAPAACPRAEGRSSARQRSSLTQPVGWAVKRCDTTDETWRNMPRLDRGIGAARRRGPVQNLGGVRRGATTVRQALIAQYLPPPVRPSTGPASAVAARLLHQGQPGRRGRRVRRGEHPGRSVVQSPAG